MLEYRRDPSTGDFRLLELNARFWGSLHLALAAGVDFPRLLLDAWLGSREPEPSWVPGVRCRQTIPGEVRHVWSVLRDGDVSRRDKLRTVAGSPRSPSTRASTPTCGGPETAASRCGRRRAGPARRERRPARRMRPRLKQSLYAGARAAGLFRLSRLLTRDALCASCAGTGRRSPTSTGSSPACSCRPTRWSAGCSRSIATRCSRSRRRCGGSGRGRSLRRRWRSPSTTGSHGTLRHAWPALQRHGFPATLYATSVPRQQRHPGVPPPRPVGVPARAASRCSTCRSSGRGWWARCG